MKQARIIKRPVSALITMSAISLSTAVFLPNDHPINRLSVSFANEDDVDEDVEEEVEEEVEDEIDEEVDEDLEDEVEDEVDEEIDDEVDEELEDEVEDEVDEEIDDEVDEELEDEVEDEVDEEIDDEVDEELEGEVEDEVDEDPEDDLVEDLSQNEDNDEDADEDGLSEVPFDTYSIELDEDGEAYTANEYLILGSPDEIDALLMSGLVPVDVTALENLDLELARVSTLGSQTRSDVEDLIAEVAPSVELDVNHLYFEQTTPFAQKSEALRAHLSFSQSANTTIGLIDTRLEQTHEAFSNARITEKDFVRIDRKRPKDHGTAIASLLVGNSDSYSGFLPNAKLYAASVFFETASGNSSATTDSLVASLDWMLQSNVDVINMSLSGPPNTILRGAVQRVQAKGILLVAAVGNDGPMASPRYPAAYEGVVGVTAISDQKTVFRLAGRGLHVDFSAPGVGIRHAADLNTYSASSGTSFAAPFVTASFALALKDHDVLTAQDVLAVTAEDLGASGLDPIYGHGLIRPPIIYHTAKAED